MPTFAYEALFVFCDPLVALQCKPDGKEGGGVLTVTWLQSGRDAG